MSRQLGRGLSALFGESEPQESDARQVRQVAVSKLHPGRFQPRRRFDPAAMDALIDSVREQGVLQPLLVRPHPDHAGEFEIIAGERRWRAAQAVLLHDVPVLVRELGDREALEVALIENIQRQDLTPLEEAEGYRRLIDEFSHTQEALAKAVGKSRSHIANMLRLLGLPEPVQGMLQDGRLTAGHARALITAADPAGLAREAAERGMSVREVERLASRSRGDRPKRAAPPPRPAPNADVNALERDLSLALGLTVRVETEGKGGRLSVEYQTLEQLDEIVQRLTRTS